MLAPGAVVLARATGIVAGLRCVFAHTGQLHLPCTPRATGVQADASHGETSGSDDAFTMDTGVGVDRVPTDRRVGLTVAWPRAGLPETRTELLLEGLDDFLDRIRPLT